VVREFPGVLLINEFHKGLAYARNAGFLAASGDIIIATDDDVSAPKDWVEKLIIPFIKDEVMAVTGNVIPLELKTPAQQLFEAYGGLGRGEKAFIADKNWFAGFKLIAVPTWRLGATANAAFRASVFRHPEIGLMEEALGPGMPSGVGEDTYLLYKILKAGFSLVYTPEGFVRHKHRREMEAFRRQIFNYSKGHIAYHLTTLFRDRDLRAIFRLLVELPLWRIYQVFQWLTRRSDYPFQLILLEIWGNLLGPIALWRSHRRVNREGRSASRKPVFEKAAQYKT
jgi:glycosyltransferase involved in cell wall biosynthesis